MNNTNRTIQEIADLINTGKAILFVGAGFSGSSIGVNGENLPRAKALARTICKLGEFEEDDDLRYATDYYIKSERSKDLLIKEMKRIFTVSETTNHQKIISGMNWRRIYTTNYDDVIEIAARASGKAISTVDISSPPNRIPSLTDICIHINGSISYLDTDALNGKFKLSSSSYVSPEGFLSSPWHYQFKRDIDSCSAIIFIGYSLYDIEIRKVLYDNQAIKAKTYFVTSEKPSPKDIFTLSEYGNVLSIGIEKFSTEIEPLINSGAGEPDCTFSLEKHDPELTGIEIRDRDSENLFLYGDIDQKLIDEVMLGEQPFPILIKRKELETIERFLEAKRHTIITGTFGNGKSIALKQAPAYFSVRGYNVYSVFDPQADFENDLKVISKKGKSIIIIDDYHQYMDLIRLVGQTKPENVFIVATSRVHAHERARIELKELSFSHQEISIDEIQEEDALQLIEIIDNLGAWGEKAGFSPREKLQFITRDNDSQVSLALLSLFDSRQIKERISSLLDFFEDPNNPTHRNYKDTVFAIALLEIIGLTASNSLISEIALNDEIYSDKLRSNDSFNQLFRPNASGIGSKSSLFYMALIKNHFLPSYSIPQLLKIAKKYGEIEGKDREENDIFRALVKFSFIERLLPDANKKSNIRNYYEKLKTSVGWLKKDPHYWLQYAMAHIPFKEYEKAQNYIDQSYAIASKKINYHTNHIDTQQGRLHLLMALEEANKSVSHNLFTKAHKMFCSIENDIYKFRQVSKYPEYFRTCYPELSKGNQAEFERACKRMINDVSKLISDRDGGPINTPFFSRVKSNLEEVVASIASDRKVHK